MFKTKKEAENFLFNTIKLWNSTDGETNINKAAELMRLLGNPQEKLKIIHIAGTSGKGSTAYITASLLQNLGFKVGLNIKPHILDIRERFQVNKSLISEKEFVSAVNKVYLAFQKMEKGAFGAPSYFQITVGLAFLIFLENNVDYAVIETGMGGLYDATNTVENPNKISVLTRIGFDHMQFLGNTLPEIAYHKARIIQKGNTVFATYQDQEIRDVFDKVAKEYGTNITYVKEDADYSSIFFEKGKTYFDFGKLKHLELGMFGRHQVENASLALRVVEYLSKRDRFEFDERKIRAALMSVQYQARIEKRSYRGIPIIIDGAHNPQKMKAFIEDLLKMSSVNKFLFLLGFKEGKDVDTILEVLVPHASSIIITDFYTDKKDWIVHSKTTEEVAVILRKLNFSNYKTVKGFKNALKEAVSSSKKSGEQLVITGSLYLIGEIYPLFTNQSEERIS